MLSLDLTDQLARFPIAYSYQPVKGVAIKHEEITLAQSIQQVKQNALGEGPWDGIEKLWADAFEITSGNYQFHSGTETDEADTLFPAEERHPWTAWISAKCPTGLSADQAEKLFGIYRTLKTADYDGAGVQIDINGDPVGGGDPRNHYFFKPNPANCAVDQLTRWGQRESSLINYPAFVDWRDYNDELIDWDDARYTPRNLSLTGTTGGSLALTTYYVRVATVKGADISSASLQTIETKASSITLTGLQNAFQVNWLLKDTITDHTAFRVYIGTTPGVWLGYFTVSNPALRALIVTTTAGVTAGNPPDTSTAGMMRQIKRFECGLFFTPPYDLATALDRICQISCADWQWSGLGTETYRNDKVRFLSPATRTPIFTLDLSQTAPRSFKTWAIDRRNRYNQIIGNFRDRDDEFLAEGSPVVMNREQMQTDDRQVKSMTIDFGTAYRSQVQRAVSFWARMLCDMDQAAALKGSFKTYPVLPADVVNVTNNMPNWTDVQFIVTKKQENVETNPGDPLSLRLYTPGMYSDSDWTPLPRNLPAPRFDPLSAPPVATNLVLTADDTFITGIIGDFDFGAFAAPQTARVFLKGPADVEPDDSTYKMVASILSDGTSAGHFELRALKGGKYWIKVATESVLGVSLATGHPVETIDLRPAAPTDLLATRDSSGDWYIGAVGHPRAAEKPESYIARIRRVADEVIMRDIPIKPGIRLAAIIKPVVHSVSGTWVPDLVSIVNNNVYGVDPFEDSFGYVYATQPVQEGTEINARVTVLPDPIYLNHGIVVMNFGLGDFTDMEDIAGLRIENISNSTTETRVTVYNWGTSAYSVTDVPTVGGVVFVRVVWLGTEVRFHFSGSPLAPASPANVVLRDVPDPTNPNHLRLGLVHETAKVENITIGGSPTPQTIYSLGQQVNDNGSGMSTIDVEMWQTSPLTGVEGLSIRQVF
jgi:hypothetical protein